VQLPPDDAPGQSAADGGAALDRRDGRQEERVELFWSIYHGNDYCASRRRKCIQAAIGRTPMTELHGLLAATHFWHAASRGRDSPPGYQVLKGDLPAAVQLFEAGAALDPNDDHLTGFVGVTPCTWGWPGGMRR